MEDNTITSGTHAGKGEEENERVVRETRTWGLGPAQSGRKQGYHFLLEEPSAGRGLEG